MALQTLDTEPAQVELEPLSRRIERVRRKRSLRVGVSSNEPATVALTLLRKRKVLARRTVRFDEAGEKRRRIRLNRAGRNALAGRDRAKIRLVAKTTDLALNGATVRTRAALR